MKCFIHTNQEAIAACRKCGKGMCADCSAYSGHSGICPECRREEFIKERDKLESSLSSLFWAMIGNVLLAVLLAITIIGGIIFAVKAVNRHKERVEKQERIAYLDSEIFKLGKALNNGRARI